MSKKVYVKKIYAYPFIDIEVYFQYENTLFYSTKRLTKVAQSMQSSKAREFELVSSSLAEEYDSCSEAKRYCRSEILIVQDIISFFVGIPLVEYEAMSTSTASVDMYNTKERDVILIIEGKDYTEQLKRVIERINQEQGLIITLFDRWRKALYLTDESCDANLYHDEAILSYFHIIELCSDIYKNLLEEELELKLNGLLSEFYSDNFFFSENQANEKVKSSIKITKKMLVGDELSLAHKIKYFLMKHNLLDDNVDYFINCLIKTRNAIAHGRITYKESLIYPLPPFFSLSSDSYEILDFLKFMTGRMIATYIGIECWEEEWEEIRKLLFPPENVLSLFLKDKNVFSEVDIISLCNGNTKNITWRTIFYHYVRNSKKISIERIGNSLKEYFIRTEVLEENSEELFEISVVLCDCSDNDVSKKAKSNIHVIIKNHWYGLNFKDLYRNLEYYNVAPEWYKKYLDNKEYLLDKFE